MIRIGRFLDGFTNSLFLWRAGENRLGEKRQVPELENNVICDVEVTHYCSLGPTD